MKTTSRWVTIAFTNLFIVALLGLTLRTKFLFPIPFIDYKNLLSAHSHFAFGGWITLLLMVLLNKTLLHAHQQSKKQYSNIFCGIQLSSVGMLCSFPFGGYNVPAIIFSTAFIICTYLYTYYFIRDSKQLAISPAVRWLLITALLSLTLSSAGPFSLAYMMASGDGNATNFRDAIYVYLHFQYNGFFTLTVLAVLFQQTRIEYAKAVSRKLHAFAVAASLSIIPSLFLSLLWHASQPWIRVMSFIGCAFIVLTIGLFCSLLRHAELFRYKNNSANLLLKLSMASFVIKMILQTGTIIPALGNAVFGFRPIIIGFLHLVFLGLVSFFILAHLIELNLFSLHTKLAKQSINLFSFAIIFNEAILLVNGLGLMFQFTHPVYGWLLWIASIFLTGGAGLMLASRLRPFTC